MHVRGRSLAWLGLVALAAAGCGKTYEDGLKAPVPKRALLGAGGAGGEEKKLAALDVEKFKRTGILKGKVVFQTTPPDKRQVVPGDNKECLAAKSSDKFRDDIYDQDWFVGEGKGVKNVLVFVRPPDGAFFPVDEEEISRPGEALVDQPFCQFHPQVVLHFPAFRTRKGELTPTGEKPVIYNKGEILHNANLQNAMAEFGNSGFNENVPPGKRKSDFSLNAQPRPLSLACSIHPWMKAHFWVFDHPYAARTDDRGEFVIENLPTDVDLQLVTWHPTIGFFGEGEAGKTIRFKSGENSISIPISPR